MDFSVKSFGDFEICDSHALKKKVDVDGLVCKVQETVFIGGMVLCLD